MPTFIYASIDVPAAAGTYIYINADGVDAAGEAVGIYGDSEGIYHGFITDNGVGTPFDPPGSTYTDVVGVTGAGEVFGDYVDAFNRGHGFVDINGVVQTINVFLATATNVYGVNDAGVIFGDYVNEADEIQGFTDTNGVIAAINVPGAATTSVGGVNAAGEIAGTITDIDGFAHGFIDINGQFTTFDPGGSILTSVVGITAAGVVVGTYEDDTVNTNHGFIYDNGVITTIDVAGALVTAVSAVNDAGEIVGYYGDSDGNVHGFIDIDGVITTIDVPGATETDILGVSNSGKITGYYNDSAGQQHGFVGVPGGNVVSGGETLNVSSGQTSNGIIVLSGGTLDVLSGGTASGTIVSSGGTEIVSSGGTASGTIVTSGGTIDVFNGGTLAGAVANDGTVNFDITGSAAFSGTLTGAGTLVVSGGGHLDVVSAYTGAAQIDDTASTLEFSSTYVGVATFSGAPTGPGSTLKLDAPSTGPITVVNSNDTVIAQPGGNNWINAAVSYTLPANIDALFLYAGAQGTGNSDAASDALYALDAGNAQTLTGNSPNDTFVVYNSSDVVLPKAGSHDVVYAAASYTLPAGVDALILEGTATQGVGNSDSAGDGLYAANPGQVATLTGNSANDTFVVYNSADVVVPKAGSNDVVYSAVNYTLPTGVDVLILEASASQGVGNSDAAGDALYAANPSQVATLTGNSANDTFVVYNAADVVVPKAGSHDIVYSAVNYTLPTGVDTLILESGTQAAGNSDAAGDTLYAASAGIAQTLTGHSHNDTFVVYNSADTVIGQAGSTDTVYAAANFILPTNVDTLFLEGNASHGTGNSDANNLLFGNTGVASTLVAGGGTDTLFVTGTAGTILTGGAGHDTFGFPNVMGHAEVTNFGIIKDTLQFNATLFSNFTAAMNAASQVGANTVFTVDANDTVTLDNVTKTSLTAGNFHFS